MLFYALCGFATIITPHLFMLFAGRKDFKEFFRQNITVSEFSLQSKRQQQFAQLSLFLNGIWSIGFLFGLGRLLNIQFLSLFTFLSLLTLVSFFGSAITLNKKDFRIHGYFGMSALVCLTLIKIVFGVLCLTVHPLLGQFSIGVGSVEAGTFAVLLSRRKWNATAMIEISYTTILSIWVFVLSLYMLFV